jgi:hypothetical protein
MKKIILVVLLLPLSFTAQAADVQATWDPVTLDDQGGPENVDHYVLYWGQTSRPGNIVHPADPTFSYDQSQNVGNTTSSQQSDFTPGQTYYFSVAAVDIGGNTPTRTGEPTRGPTRAARTPGAGMNPAATRAARAPTRRWWSRAPAVAVPALTRGSWHCLPSRSSAGSGRDIETHPSGLS